MVGGRGSGDSSGMVNVPLLFQQPLAEDPHRLTRAALVDDVAMAQHHGPVADGAHLVRRVGDQKDGAALPLEFLHPLDALALEPLVAHRQHFVDDQDVGVHVDRHREPEPDVHPGGVELHLPVDELLELGEVDDVVEDPVDLLLGHAEHRSVQVDVLPTGQVLLEPGAELQQPGQLPPHHDLARGGLEHPADALEQGRLA